ncbi:hypothetical protein [Streptomyces sp. NPDC055005]
MEITRRTLTEVWQRTAARHALLEQVALPPVVSSQDELEERAARADEARDGGLYLLLGEDRRVDVPPAPRHAAGGLRGQGGVRGARD